MVILAASTLPTLDALGWGYYLLSWLLLAADVFFPPLPAEMLVAAGAADAWHGPHRVAGFFTMVLVATLGGFAGDVALYTILRYQCRQWLIRRRFGRWLYNRIIATMNKVGPATSYTALVVLRLVSGGRTAVVAASGLVGITWPVFLATAAAGSLLWGIYMPTLGVLAQEVTGLPLWLCAGVAMVVGTVFGLGLAWLMARNSLRTPGKQSSNGVSPAPPVTG